MPETTTQPIEHCPRFPAHCSLECMERMRAEFGSYALSEPPFEEWCPMAKALQRQEEDRRRAGGQREERWAETGRRGSML